MIPTFTNEDVWVVGLSPQGVLLRDICLDVPHQRLVMISGPKASISQDLWRALAQQQLFRVHNIGYIPVADSNDKERIIAELKSNVQKLTEELNTLRSQNSNLILEKILQTLERIENQRNVHIPNVDFVQTPLQPTNTKPNVSSYTESVFVPSFSGNVTPVDIQSTESQSNNTQEAISLLKKQRG